MGFLDFLTGGDKSKVVDGGIEFAKTAAKGIDAIWYTAEEKAENSIKITEGKQELIKSINKFVSTTFKENSIRSITRRYLAWAIIGNSIALSWFSLVFYALGAYTSNDAWYKVSDRAWETLAYWGSANLAVVVCYFGYYGISNIVSKVNKKPEASK